MDETILVRQSFHWPAINRQEITLP